VEITATAKEDGIHIEGGGIYEPEQKRFFLKCNSCFQKNSILKKYQPCEVYSRVVGYLRPVAQWNDAKQSEFKDRKLFDRNISGKNYRVENQNTDNLRTNAA
jgi:anaerobic ribonucleoside-triphosphate reductase